MRTTKKVTKKTFHILSATRYKLQNYFKTTSSASKWGQQSCTTYVDKWSASRLRLLDYIKTTSSALKWDYKFNVIRCYARRHIVGYSIQTTKLFKNYQLRLKVGLVVLYYVRRQMVGFKVERLLDYIKATNSASKWDYKFNVIRCYARRHIIGYSIQTTK